MAGTRRFAFDALTNVQILKHSVFCDEGGTVGALRYGGIGFVCYDLDFVERAIVLASAMVGTLRYGTSDRMIGSVASSALASVFVFVHFL